MTMKQSKIAVIAGSLRRRAYSRMMAQALIERAPPSLACTLVEIGALPLYNEDLETASPPPAWTEFRNALKAAQGVLFVTPEYNRSMPGALKNALDVGSRPWGRSAWDGKPAAVLSITPGALGAMAANNHLRQVLYAVNLSAMAYPEAYVPAAATLFDDGGRLIAKETAEFASAFLQAFELWVERFTPAD
jgi:chromate reductase, NAD(P)H dehydrogenase (quinone)